jgi:UDP-N-acetyl-D-galactosamine dehydrogenase
VLGLGYVGLPLAVEFAKRHQVIGFDIDAGKVEELRRNYDRMREVETEELAAVRIDYTTDPAKMRDARYIIVAVPTPIDEHNNPDLFLVEEASRMVGKNMARGATVVYESTVYPGVTEDICLPILEKESGMRCPDDFTIGYSPERVNPGDKQHVISKVVKIVSGCNEETLEPRRGAVRQHHPCRRAPCREHPHRRSRQGHRERAARPQHRARERAGDDLRAHEHPYP